MSLITNNYIAGLLPGTTCTATTILLFAVFYSIITKAIFFLSQKTNYKRTNFYL